MALSSKKLSHSGCTLRQPAGIARTTPSNSPERVCDLVIALSPGRRKKNLQSNSDMWPDNSSTDSMSELRTQERSSQRKRGQRTASLMMAAEREYMGDFSGSYCDAELLHDEDDILSRGDAARCDKFQTNNNESNEYRLILLGDDAPTVAETTDSSIESSDGSVEDGDAKVVRFSTVSIRTYSITVGTHTKVNAYPLALDWHHTATETIDVDLFEDVFSSARTKPQRKLTRGFRRPQRLSPAARFRRLRTVTGQSQNCIYELELARTTQQDNEIPHSACHSDDGYVEDGTRTHPYELCGVDDYQVVEV